MNILIFTNTFTPHIGGVARSVEGFTREYRKRGHRVLIIAPEFPDMPRNEVDVFRIEAIQNFNASDFSVALPVHAPLTEVLDDFQPDIVHSQHPFLLGMTALRVARYRELPLVFTHHTLYEQYTHYIPGDSSAMQRFAIELATRYANLTDRVFAPSESICDLIKSRGVTTPVSVVPTGVDLNSFAMGDGMVWRQRLGISQEAFVIGHLGRLAQEKNLDYLTQAVADFIALRPDSHFLAVGAGPFEGTMREIFANWGVETQLHAVGILEGQPLADALHTMSVFAFTSTSETQGMVLTEAMAAGLPVVALDASGVREVVRDHINGLLLQQSSSQEQFSDALRWVADLKQADMHNLRVGAHATAKAFSISHTADLALEAYASILEPDWDAKNDKRDWEDVFSWVQAEWEILKSFASACGAAAGTNHSLNRTLEHVHK